MNNVAKCDACQQPYDSEVERCGECGQPLHGAPSTGRKLKDAAEELVRLLVSGSVRVKLLSGNVVRDDDGPSISDQNPQLADAIAAVCVALGEDEDVDDVCPCGWLVCTGCNEGRRIAAGLELPDPQEPLPWEAPERPR